MGSSNLALLVFEQMGANKSIIRSAEIISLRHNIFVCMLLVQTRHGSDEDFSICLCKDVTINDKTGHIVLAFISSKGKSISRLGQEQMA